MFKKDSSPGPGYFIDARISRYGRDGNPSYSILGRQKDPSKCHAHLAKSTSIIPIINSLDCFKTPAPGTYSPEKVHPQGERHAPVYSMGQRSRYRKQDTVPSANSYTLPQLIGSKVPSKQSSAAFSMTGRSKTGNFAEDLAKTPGPGRYNGVDPNVTGKKAPGYSMLGRSFMPGGQKLFSVFVPLY